MFRFWLMAFALVLSFSLVAHAHSHKADFEAKLECKLEKAV